MYSNNRIITIENIRQQKPAINSISVTLYHNILLSFVISNLIKFIPASRKFKPCQQIQKGTDWESLFKAGIDD